MSKHVTQILPMNEYPLRPGDTQRMVVGLALVDHGNDRTGVELIVRDTRTGLICATEGFFKGFIHIEDLKKAGVIDDVR